MKHRLILLLFCLFSFTPLYTQVTQRIAKPEYIGIRPGTVNLSNGIYWGEVTSAPATEALAEFLEKEGIEINRYSRSRKNIVMRTRQVRTIPHVPRNARNSYGIQLESNRITIEYTSEQGLSLACLQLEEFIRRESFVRGVVLKKRSLPCSEIRSWMPEGNSAAFRQATPETEVPLHAIAVEAMLTDPLRGWLPDSRALWQVGYTEPLYTGRKHTCEELTSTWNKWVANGLEVIPVFGLSGSNEPFERVTGHPMLSVEGMRFVRLLLDDFFSQCHFPAVGFIVPEGRYRKQIEEIVGRYPHVTDLRFFDE